MLYVALTRPCHACWLGMGVMGKITKKYGETTDLHQSGIGYLLNGGDMILTHELSAILAKVKGDCDAIAVTALPDLSSDITAPEPEAQDLLPARTFAGTIPKNWRITSYSGILTGAAMPDDVRPLIEPIVESPDSPVQDQLQESAGEESLSFKITPGARSIHTFARGPEPGTFLHDMLEWAAHTGFDQVSRDPAGTRDKVNALCSRREWDTWSDVLSNWLLELVQTPLPLPGSAMTLSDLGTDHCRAEMEFLFAAHRADFCDIDRLVTDTGAARHCQAGVEAGPGQRHAQGIHRPGVLF